MKRMLPAVALMQALVVAADDPQVSGVSLTQDVNTRQVTVTYDLLGANAIVTVEFLTNGAPVAAADCARVSGDVNKMVSAGTGKTIRWTPTAFASPPAPELANAVACVKAWTTTNPPPYMVQDMLEPFGRFYYEAAENIPGGVQDRQYKTTKMVFRRIPAAGVTFKMGSPSGEAERKSNEDYHEVTLLYDFWLGIYPVTQGQYMTILKTPKTTWLQDTYGSVCPGSFSNEVDAALYPVDHLSTRMLRNEYGSLDGSYYNRKMEQGFLWHFSYMCGFYEGTLPDALKNADATHKADLPSEAEWEFACRAGSGDPRNAEGTADEIAWHSGNSGGKFHPVGMKKPNVWGLYDMLGGVWEICRDGYAANLGTAAVENPFTGNGYGGRNVKRGGSIWEDASYSRNAARSLINTRDYPMNGNQGDGFRIMIPLW